ncbi:GNAT family N-acetyltransferase [Candidatus Regiella endosymbiont of Tuberolachnus salignus]|uniref:GNAT family N-acetyltransferase n=1 Tax=Candidatus Regiella endosymbiont of Tuberolachnus salignus TaxID=3077956 RepID=UPI0030D62572
MGKITAPVLLSAEYDTTSFNSGVLSLDEWLIKRALKNQNTGASRTFVICENNRVAGYYALATGSVERWVVQNSIARNMPDPIPVIVLGRLAIDRQYQRRRLGAALLKDAMLRTLSVAQSVGVRCLLVHAISEEAKKFYLNYGFLVSPIEPMTLILPIQHIKGYFTE